MLLFRVSQSAAQCSDGFIAKYSGDAGMFTVVFRTFGG
jgi:hypothetical protein